MNKKELLEKLKFIEESLQRNDIEVSHIEADNALLNYLNDQEITDAYEKIPKWYA